MSKAKEVLSMTKSEARIGTLKKRDLDELFDELDSYAQENLPNIDQVKKVTKLIDELRRILL